MPGDVDPQPTEQPQPPQRTPHGDAVIFGLAAVLLLALTAVAGHVLALPRLWWAVGAAIAVVLCCAVARLEGGATMVTWWWWAAFSVAGGWLGWVRFAAVRTAAPWLWLAGGAVMLATAYPLMRHRHDKRVAAWKRREEEREREKEVNRWPRLLERVGCPGVKVTGREDTDSGYVLGLRLPGHGKVTVRKLRQALDALEIAADARRGSLSFEEGETAREVLLYVSTRDYLAETIPYEDNGELFTIQNPIEIGRYEDGTPCWVTLREICLLIVGLRGSGKSNLLNVLIAQLVRCVDVLLLIIDTKYRLVMPWVRPYLEDERYGMAIDWAATNRTEAEIMLRAFVHGIEARAEAGGAAGQEKVEPDPEQPAVFLVADEIADIMGLGTGPKSSAEGTTNYTLAGIGLDGVRKGRSEAMDMIVASQRGTVTMTGGGDFKSQFDLRIGLRVQNEADARTVIPDDLEAAKILASLRHEGTGLVQYRDGRPMRVKFFRITPEQVGEIARRYGPMKPEPEPVLAAALGIEYEERWERFRSTKKATGRTDTDREFREIAAHLGDVNKAVAEEVPAGRKRMRAFVARSGDRGVTVKMIVDLLVSEHMGVTERQVRRWLDDDAALIERTARGWYRSRKVA